MSTPRATYGPDTRNRAAGAALLALALWLGGCATPGYYPQAISGHFKLMAARQPVEEYLAQAPPDQQLAQRLRLATGVLAFAHEQLLLSGTDEAYQQVAVTGRKAVVWNVVATDEFSLEPRRWCFPVAGCVPYLGYFKQTAAEQKAAKLARQGYDTTVSPASAYSTLGWFDDPLLDTLLLQPEPAVAATLIHELAHQQLYVPGDTAFNESFASFVEEEGLRRWLLQRNEQAQWQQWQRAMAARTQFLQLLQETRSQLEEVYAADITLTQQREAKQQVFDTLAERHQRLVEQHWQGHAFYGDWINSRPNNADLALMGQYHDGLCAFTRLYEQSGGELARFYQAAAVQARLPAEQRHAWLLQPC